VLIAATADQVCDVAVAAGTTKVTKHATTTRPTARTPDVRADRSCALDTLAGDRFIRHNRCQPCGA
jgi:hypothetical protein